MKRNHEKLINDYRKLTEKDRWAEFYASDFSEILRTAGNAFDAVSRALEVGFMVGYRYARRGEAMINEEFTAMRARIWAAFDVMIEQDQRANVELLKRYYMAGMTNTINEALRILEIAAEARDEDRRYL